MRVAKLVTVVVLLTLVGSSYTLILPAVLPGLGGLGGLGGLVPLGLPIPANLFLASIPIVGAGIAVAATSTLSGVVKKFMEERALEHYHHDHLYYEAPHYQPVDSHYSASEHRRTQEKRNGYSSEVSKGQSEHQRYPPEHHDYAKKHSEYQPEPLGYLLKQNESPADHHESPSKQHRHRRSTENNIAMKLEHPTYPTKLSDHQLKHHKYPSEYSEHHTKHNANPAEQIQSPLEHYKDWRIPEYNSPLVEIAKVESLVASGIYSMDTQGCLAKLLCYLRDQDSHSLSLGETSLLQIFSQEENVLVTEVDRDSEGKGRCSKATEKCFISNTDLREIFRMTQS